MTRAVMSWGVWMARVRMAFARRPWAYWALAGTLGAFAALQVHGAVSAAHAARAAWGTTANVWVVAQPAAAGDPVAALPMAVPLAMVPVGAVEQVPPGAVAAHDLAEGAVVTATDLRRPDDLPTDWLVVTAPADRSPTLAPGDPVDVLGASGHACSGAALRAVDDSVEVAVPPDCATALTADLLADDVVVARRTG